MTDKRLAVVEGLLATGYVNVSCAGQHIPNVPYPSWYAPVVGDAVVLDYVGQQIFVATCLTPGRLVVSTVTILNSGTPGAGWDQIASTYAKSGIASNPPLTLVRTTPVTPPTSITVPALASRTWSPDWPTWRTDNAKVSQGSYGSGQQYGLWFYGSGAFSGLGGHTVTSLTMTVVRDTAGGTSWGPMQLHLYQHNYTTQPGSGPPTIVSGPNDAAGAAPSLGATVTFSLPVSWGQTLQAGTQAGIAISSPFASDQMACLGPDLAPTSGTLIITYV